MTLLNDFHIQLEAIEDPIKHLWCSFFVEIVHLQFRVNLFY